MTRFNQAFAAAALLFVIPTMASALGIQLVNVSSTNADPHTLFVGDEVTFDLRLENATNVDVYGLDIIVSGYDQPGVTPLIESGLELVGGQVVTSALNSIYIAGAPNVNGLANARTAPTQVWAPVLQYPQPVRTSLFAGVDIAAHNGNGGEDNGVLGGRTGAGDIHFRVTYRLASSNGVGQNLLLNFGTDSALGHPAIGAGGDEIPFQNATYALTVIPEPGTALLMGLGLLGLAARRR